MVEYYCSDPFILSSSCPYSRSLIAFAYRLGGILDPEFLNQCKVTDKNFQKSLNELKQIPLKYDSTPSDYQYQEELFLDIDIPYKKKQFHNSYQFRRYNSWLTNENQWNIIPDFNGDLII